MFFVLFVFVPLCLIILLITFKSSKIGKKCDPEESKGASEHLIQEGHCEVIVQGFIPLGSDLEWS